MQNIKKILIASLIVIAVGAYAVYKKAFGIFKTDSNSNPDENSSQTTPSNGANKMPGKIPAITDTSVVVSGPFKDGTYTGKVVDAYYGPIQVKLTIDGGKITAVDTIVFPNDRPTTVKISNDSIPVLESEAIKAQSSKIDIISGATQTAEGFIETLKSALSQAKM